MNDKQKSVHRVLPLFSFVVYLQGLLEILVGEKSAKELLFPKPQISVDSTIEYVIVDFNAWEYCATDELWAGLIRGLYQEVEKKFAVENESIKLQWRVQRAVDILKEEFGGMTALFARLVALTVAIAFLLVSTVCFDSLKIKTSKFDEIQLGTVASTSSSAYYLWNTCNKIFKSTEKDRGQAIYSEANSVKDKIGFMAKVRKELSELFKFINKDFKDRTQKQLRLVLFIDDLDRCLGGRNVKMLEAIQLLLNVPGAPVFIFLAIDSRVVVASIEQHLNKSLKLEDAVITGWEYLEKIVQIPFCIPEISGERAVRYMTNIIRKEVTASTITSLFSIIKAQYDFVDGNYSEQGNNDNLELWIDFPKTVFKLLEVSIGGVCIKAATFVTKLLRVTESEDPLVGLEELSAALRVAQHRSGRSIVQTHGKEGREILCQQLEILFRKSKFFYCECQTLNAPQAQNAARDAAEPPRPLGNRELRRPTAAEEIKSDPIDLMDNQKRLRIVNQGVIVPNRDALISLEGSHHHFFPALILCAESRLHFQHLGELARSYF